jgi:hypothetical protein
MGIQKRCSKPGCFTDRRGGQRYCRKHHAEYMKSWRLEHKLNVATLLARVKDLEEENSELRSRG